MKTPFFLVLTYLALSSCSSYVQSVHRQIDYEERSKRSKRTKYYYNNKRTASRYPITLGASPSANSQRNILPHKKRNYNQSATRRHKAQDLVDNQGDGSLWSGDNSESFLFVNNNLKKKGDIVIIEVLAQLKTRIQDELKRAFPEKAKRKKKKSSKDPETPPEIVTNSPQKEGPNKVHDKISTSVIEQVNQDYVLVRGRKEVLYKKFKRYFEFQAIVSQKDITNRDSVTSTKLLESKINVLRY